MLQQFSSTFCKTSRRCALLALRLQKAQCSMLFTTCYPVHHIFVTVACCTGAHAFAAGEAELEACAIAVAADAAEGLAAAAQTPAASLDSPSKFTDAINVDGLVQVLVPAHNDVRP